MKALKNATLNAKLIASFKIALVLLVFSSCAVRSVYIPVSQNVPLFDSVKSLHLNAYVGGNHIELQGAINPVRKLALASNINFGTGISIYDFAVGTYGYSKNANWRYELFGGYGHNSNFAFQTANYNSLIKQPIKNYEVRSLYDKYYIQPSFGYFGHIKMYKLNYSFALSARVSALYYQLYSFKEIDDAASQVAGQNIYIHDVNYKNRMIYLLEPCFTNKIGYRNVYITLQCQGFVPYSEQVDISNTVFSQALIFSAGLEYQLRFKSKK